MFSKFFGFGKKKEEKEKQEAYEAYSEDNNDDVESSEDISSNFEQFKTSNSPTSELDEREMHLYFDDGAEEKTELSDIIVNDFAGETHTEIPEEEIDINEVNIDNSGDRFMSSYDVPIEDDSEDASNEPSVEEIVATETEEANEPVLEENEDVAYGEPAKEKKGFFAKLKDGLSKTRAALSSNIDNVLKAFTSIDEDLYEALEEALIMADIGAETSMYIIEELRNKVKKEHIHDNSEVKGALREIISEIMSYDNNGLKLDTKPSVMIVIGVNGVGKTTSIGKIANRLKSEGKSVMLAAGDSFRAGAIDQLQVWADRVNVPIVKHQEGADPGAVIFDAIASAKAKNIDVVICDTAGRLHNKANLMKELEKIFRIIDRELPQADKEVLLVLDATTGQNAVAQAKTFGDVAKLSGIILTKLDGTAKGGIVITISKELSIPVKLIGVGEGIDDMREFDPKDYALALFPEDEE